MRWKIQNGMEIEMATSPRISVNTDRSAGLCFGCGQNNPIGLKLRFEREGRVVRAEFAPDKHYQGWPGVVHGGIITCMLDEAMSHAAHFEGLSCLTVKMGVRFKRPTLVDEPLVITGSITRRKRRLKRLAE